jgi:hypothetical protein
LAGGLSSRAWRLDRSPAFHQRIITLLIGIGCWVYPAHAK